MEADKKKERSFIMIKPDGVQRGLVGKVISRFEDRGYKLVGMKMVTPPKALVEEHYVEHKGKKFLPFLVDYIISGPCVPMVFEGLEVIATGRKMIGATKPLEASPGTIRGDFAQDVGRNIVHGSDSVDSAKREIGLWFKPEEISAWDKMGGSWLYE